MTALRVSIAETLSTVSKAKARSATLWRRVEKLRAFFFQELCQVHFKLIELITLNTEIIKKLSKGNFA